MLSIIAVRSLAPEVAVEHVRDGSPPRKVETARRQLHGGPEPALLRLQRAVGNAALARQLGTKAAGQPLEGATRGRLESRYGADLSAVRVKLDGAATGEAGAVAFTVGSQVVVDPAYYRPGTLGGDVLLAHEVAHTVQQREGAGTGAGAAVLEAEADRSALAAVGEHTPADGFLPRLRAALSLQRCRGCSPRELALAEQIRGENDPVRLADLLRPATDDQLRRADEAIADGTVPRDSVQGQALAWERALRAKDFRAIADLNRRGNAGFRTAHGPRILEMVMSGGTTLKVDAAGGREFVEFIHSGLQQLLDIEAGFGLVVDLLATGQQVTLKRGAEHNTDPVDDSRTGRTAMDHGRLVQQTGQGTGSVVTLDPDLLTNQATLGTDDNGRPAIIDMEAAPTIGHELIHALHNARGDNLRPLVPTGVLGGLGGGVGLVRDPVTGEGESPEELRATTGQISFQQINPRGTPDTPVSFPGGPAVSEDTLRRQAHLPQRTSHVGFLKTVTIARRGAHNVDDLVPRYRLNGGPPPPEVTAVLRTVMTGHSLTAALLTQPGDQIPVPHPEYVRMHIRFVEGSPALADRLDQLTVQ